MIEVLPYIAGRRRQYNKSNERATERSYERPFKSRNRSHETMREYN